MIVAGIDLGARRTKVVVLTDGVEVGRAEAPTGPDFEGGAAQALKAAGWPCASVDYVLATGNGRYRLGWRDGQATEVICLARALSVLAPGSRRVLDLGAQTMRAVLTDQEGRIVAFRFNDRCASGGGRFLERASRLLHEARKEAVLAALSNVPCRVPILRSVCAVLGESEIVSLVSQGTPPAEILAAVCLSIGARSAQVLGPLGGEGPVLMAGGPTESVAVRQALAMRIEGPLLVPPAPPFVTAIGAASLAHQRATDVRRHTAVGPRRAEWGPEGQEVDAWKAKRTG